MKPRTLNQNGEVSELFFGLTLAVALTVIGAVILRLAFWLF